MSAHPDVVVEWVGGGDFLANHYSRAHTIAFDGGVTLPGSASPSVVRAPWSVEAAADPEEMLVAAISACHMLWFLDFARRDGLEIRRYRDAAVGHMGRDAAGRTALVEAVLSPALELAPGVEVDASRLAALHEAAHGACFIANSVTATIRIEPVAPTSGDSAHG